MTMRAGIESLQLEREVRRLRAWLSHFTKDAGMAKLFGHAVHRWEAFARGALCGCLREKLPIFPEGSWLSPLLHVRQAVGQLATVLS
jgi:hypothetical protein